MTKQTQDESPAGSVTPRGVGICGAGERGVYVLGRRMEESVGEVGLEVRGIYDRNPHRAEESREYLAGIRERDTTEITVHTTLGEMLADPSIEIVLVTSYTAAHREQTQAALGAGKLVYLDKPISATFDDAMAISRAERESGSSIIMGFTRRYEPAWRTAFDLVESGAIGDLQMILLRSIIPYARYLQRWHRFTELSGGAFNDKCSHHFDVFRWFVGSEPVAVQATGGRSSVFAPDPTAPKRCRDCDRDCPFRALPSDTVQEIGLVHRLDKDFQTVSGDRWEQESWNRPDSEEDVIDACVFDPENEMWDHMVSTVTFDSGVKATLFWSIFGTPADDQETLELVGSSGKVFLERSTGTVTLVNQYGANREVIEPDRTLESSHFGADLQLVRDIAAMADHPHPPATVHDGVESLRLVEATRRSALSGGSTVQISEVY
ncbi:MAG TPA: Gfo/Idh/MocA family oxidoreductase [Alkalispirochaeta sp.]|nr:Gfo/Idh/MocA family oxidoreductase [Alkalispirochaeta sp.]